MYLPIVMLGWLSGDEAVGQFAAAHRIVNVFQVCVTVYWLSFYPKLSRHATLPSMNPTLIKSLWQSCSLMAICAAALALRAESLMQLAFGREFGASTAVSVLQIMVWRVPLMMFRSHPRQALFVRGKQSIELLASLANLLVLIGLAWPAAGSYGVVGVAVAALIAECLGAAVTWAIWSAEWRRTRNGHL
jgi:O-antigen/teichoic acid export membrane protein